MKISVIGAGQIGGTLVRRFIDELGFGGVDAGGLDESWRQQPDTPVYAKDLDADGVRQALVKARRERGPEWRATARSAGSHAVG